MVTLMSTAPAALFHSSLVAEATVRKDNAISSAADAAAKAVVRAQPIADFYRTADVRVALDFAVEQLLPRRVLPWVKKTLRRDMREPADVKVR